MANFPIIAAAYVTWLFRTFLLIFLLLSIWSFSYPDRYRQWNLSLYRRYRWLASPRHHEKMRTASVKKLRFQSGAILIYLAIVLIASFKVLH